MLRSKGMDKALKLFALNSLTETTMSSPQEVSTLVQVLQALNIGTLIPSAFAVALLWKLYGFFNDLSEKLTRIETKVDALKEILPYKIKECIEQSDNSKTEAKHVKHNPSIEWTDLVEIIGITFGLVDFIIFFGLLFTPDIGLSEPLILLLFIIPAFFGLVPIFVSKKKISRIKRALLSLVSIIPWIYIALLFLNLTP